MKTFLVLIILFTLCSCAGMHYKAADGAEVTYTRFLAGSDSINVTVGNATAQVNGAKVDIDALKAVLGLMGAVK